MANAVEETAPPDPLFITRIFSLKRYSCHFIVGNKSLIEPVKIGVLPEMLIVHSDALQSDMLLTEIENNKCVVVEDMYPDTFRNLMKYVYGYDNTGSLTFDEADNLLYAAEKYLIEPLKDRLATRLSKLISPENICSLLNNPACFKTLELNSAITKILQCETERVLASPQLLELTSDALTKVFEQDTMNVPEIEVWRAAVKWAKHRATSDNGQVLREVLKCPAKQIRVCVIDGKNSVDEVYPSGIVTDEEVKMITFSRIKEEENDDLIGFSNKLVSRSKPLLAPSQRLDFVQNKIEQYRISANFYILTNKLPIELLPLKCKSKKWGNTTAIPKGLTYQCKCTINITRITDYVKDTSNEPPETVEHCLQVEYDTELSVPLTKGGKNIVLQPNNKYRVAVNFNDDIPMFYCLKDPSPYTNNEHLSVRQIGEKILMDFVEGYKFYMLYFIPCQSLFYRPITF